VKLARLRRPKASYVLSYWNIDLIQMQQYYEKQVTLKGCHIAEGAGKGRKLRKEMWLMYSLYKNEYRIFKLFQTTIRRGLWEKEEK
jgi:hypothetical protein